MIILLYYTHNSNEEKEDHLIYSCINLFIKFVYYK